MHVWNISFRVSNIHCVCAFMHVLCRMLCACEGVVLMYTISKSEHSGSFCNLLIWQWHDNYTNMMLMMSYEN